MLCDSLNRELRVACRGLLVFLDRSFSSAMGCFFVCLRVKDKDDDDRDLKGRPHVSSIQDKKSDVAASRKQLSSLFAAEERVDCTAGSKGNRVSGSPHTSKEIEDEARFLKACGTIPETPVEIRKAGEKLRRSPPNETRCHASEFHSWMPDDSVRKHQTDKKPENLSRSELTSESPGHMLIRPAGMNFVDGAASGNLGSEVIDEETSCTRTPFTTWPAGRNNHGASMSVHFNRDVNAHPHEKLLPRDAVKELTSEDCATVILPHPTPLKLSDAMHTPGTIFPANMENAQRGKANIISQDAYLVPNPIPEASQGNAIEEGKDQHDRISGEQRKNIFFSATATAFLSDLSNGVLTDQEAKFEATLSAWLKPPPESGRNFQPTFRRTYGDRPILGLVATHWNEEEQSHITPKWWDGNGIPNSTSKYKEDQKVSWHATPFEERLEKALSEESSLGNRSHVSGSTTLEEDSDSAISRLRSTPQKNTLVSC